MIQPLQFTIKRAGRLALSLALAALLLALAAPALAQEAGPGDLVEFTGLLPAALTWLLPIGLILMISSAMPEEQAPAMAVTLLLVWGLAGLAYFGLGFAFQFGGIAQVSSAPDLAGLYWEWYPLDQSVDLEAARLWGVIALRGWALSGEAATPGAFLLFLSHLPLVGVAAIIPAGAIPQRVRGITAGLIGLLTGAVLYPLPGNWLWGGGWLANLGANLGLGHGLVDFGGGSVVFLLGSLATLVALILFRPQPDPEEQAGTEIVVASSAGHSLTVYEEPAEAAEELLPVTPMPSAYLPLLSFLGAGLAVLGWFGLSAGIHAPTAVNFSPAQAAVNGALAALGAALAAAGYSWFTTRAFNPLMTGRGMLAGLVVMAAGAPFVPAWLALVAGLLMGLLTPLLIYTFERRLPLADERGTLATYGISSLTGLVLVAFFANGRAGQGWNGLGLADYNGVTGQGVSGLLVAPGFASDWPGQLQAQLLGAGAIMVWAILLSFLLLQSVAVVAKAWRRSGLELAGPPARPAGTPAPQEPAEPETRYSLPPDSAPEA